MNTSCCAEMTACANNAACLAARTCFGDCTTASDTACIDACADAHPGYLDANRAMVGCRNEQCGFECALDTCVGAITWPVPEEASRAITHTFRDFQSGDPVAGLTVVVCAKSDLTCSNPLGEGVTDAQGAVTLDMPTDASGFDAFLDVSGPNHVSTDFWFLSRDPEASLASGSISLQILSKATVTLLTGLAEVSLDPARGSVTFVASDCGDRALAGLSVTADSADGDSVTVYLMGSFPSTELPATHVSGTGAILNMPPGPALLTGTGKDGRVWSQHTVNVRAGRMVGTNMRPTPLD
jgi:hypothetical protein